jgi:hemerythrin-like domain-containing protein
MPWKVWRSTMRRRWSSRSCSRSTPEDERFKAKATVLKEMIEHHIKEEEDKIFDDLEAKNKGELDEIFSQFEEEKERLKSDITATA